MPWLSIARVRDDRLWYGKGWLTMIHGSWPVCPRGRLTSNERGVLVSRAGKTARRRRTADTTNCSQVRSQEWPWRSCLITGEIRYAPLQEGVNKPSHLFGSSPQLDRRKVVHDLSDGEGMLVPPIRWLGPRPIGGSWRNRAFFTFWGPGLDSWTDIIIPRTYNRL
ncbi:hypothetical protein CONLIGDRAFT_317848 [Coniochaeta ligniaria NRRL 30616]|uniref:Uncharacterized protein n=1 Tax=Coniochaeta ligniaria NRRL 30616 TaxID=1408157 RepID=A0A1J7JNG2_9PEZI|nr:hypothetical protein CONLIGDRAFT_317848 [Coniochaeta ligniaria NRRL 30616]